MQVESVFAFCLVLCDKRKPFWPLANCYSHLQMPPSNYATRSRCEGNQFLLYAFAFAFVTRGKYNRNQFLLFAVALWHHLRIIRINLKAEASLLPSEETVQVRFDLHSRIDLMHQDDVHVIRCKFVAVNDILSVSWPHCFSGCFDAGVMFLSTLQSETCSGYRNKTRVE